MNSIDGYIILNKKTNNFIKFYLFVSLFIFLILIIFLQCKYKKYYNTIGQVIKDDNTYQMLVYIPIDKLEVIKSNDKLLIDNKIYDYKIDYIDSDYMIDSSLENSIKIIVNLNLEKEDRIVNNILNIKFEEDNQKIIYYLKEYLMKGSSI